MAGGGQIGYSRQLIKTDDHLLVSEIGYDYSYERYVQQPMRTLDPVSIHSARLFVGETMKVSSSSAPAPASRRFFNLNREGKAPRRRDRHAGRGCLQGHPHRGQAGLTTTVWPG